jgi:hypothetical protein
MPNGDDATLPTPTPPQGQDPQKTQVMLQLLSKILPSIGGALGQPQQGQQPQVQQQPRQQQAPLAAPQPAQMQTKFDPMSSVGSLPKPVEMPLSQGARPDPNSKDILAKLDPHSAARYAAVQGVTQYISSALQKRDQEKHSEAANAAQALMSALEGAKTTGDYTPAQHIFENNEALFNKVYKGWMQKAEDAQKEKEKAGKAKKPDPEIAGFEAALGSYMGKGAASQPGQPKPPSTLQGKSGAKYFIPQAAPPQALQQQEQSRQMQQQRQDPNQVPMSPADQVKLQENLVNLEKAKTEYQKAMAEVQKAQTEQQKAVAEAQTAKTQGETQKQIDQTRLLGLQTQADIATARLQNTIAQGKNIKARGVNADKISSAYKVRFAAIDQAEQMLTTMKADKRDFSPSDVRDLQQHLNTAGARNLAGSLNKTFSNHWYMPDSFTKPTVDQLMDSLKQYKQNLMVLVPAQPSDDSVDKSDDETIDDSPDTPDDSGAITVSPEDMK